MGVRGWVGSKHEKGGGSGKLNKGGGGRGAAIAKKGQAAGV